MSRSYHITHKVASARVKAGDPSAIDELREKRVVKETLKKYRADYPAVRPSAKTRKLKSSFVVGMVKEVLRPKNERQKPA